MFNFSWLTGSSSVKLPVPVAPTQVQLDTAKQAMITAATNYNALLAHYNAVNAYNQVIQQEAQNISSATTAVPVQSILNPNLPNNVVGDILNTQVQAELQKITPSTNIPI